MRNTQNIIIKDLSINRIVVRIDGESLIPLKKLVLKDSITNTVLDLHSVKWEGSAFHLSFNLMSLNHEHPIESGDWYLIGIDKNNKNHECYPVEELIKGMKERTFNISNKYNAYFDKSQKNYYYAESKIDEDNQSYFLKIEYAVPSQPLTFMQKRKKAYKKHMHNLSVWGFVKTFNFFKKFNKPNGNRLLFTSSSRSEIGGNQLYVYNRMKERGVDQQFKIDFSYKANIKDRRGLLNKFSFTRKLAMANIIICDDYQPELYHVEYADGVEIIQLWHACGAFKTVGLERMGKPGAPAFDTNVHKCYTAMTVSSPLAAAHYAEAFGIDESKIVSLGVPRTDIFFDEEYKKEIIPKVKAAFPQIENADEVIMYAPTFRGINARYAYFPMDMIDFDGFGEYLEKHNSVMLIKMHPFVREPLPIPEKYKDRIIDASSYREINNMLFVTDLLITDYSSVIYEFSLFNKPMLFYAFDRMKYEADRGFYEPYAKMVPGKIVRTSEDLIASLEARDFEYEKVAPFVKKNFSYTDGKSTDRIIDQLILKNK
jgi:CDP-ribitol ribitolphosphotransferase